MDYKKKLVVVISILLSAFLYFGCDDLDSNHPSSVTRTFTDIDLLQTSYIEEPTPSPSTPTQPIETPTQTGTETHPKINTLTVTASDRHTATPTEKSEIEIVWADSIKALYYPLEFQTFDRDPLSIFAEGIYYTNNVKIYLPQDPQPAEYASIGLFDFDAGIRVEITNNEKGILIFSGIADEMLNDAYKYGCVKYRIDYYALEMMLLSSNENAESWGDDYLLPCSVQAYAAYIDPVGELSYASFGMSYNNNRSIFTINYPDVPITTYEDRMPYYWFDLQAIEIQNQSTLQEVQESMKLIGIYFEIIPNLQTPMTVGLRILDTNYFLVPPTYKIICEN